ncbi:uncharacterized protein HMPREF1541_02752 [Cyphellophora europaea CBS 101466]|uniref:Peptidase M20 dimerisation domain-containing protein n=1 Tax=Cyphellophora europaea (strain CBS 101466) TaxID=1220924 RepID=W2S6D5_CYPE1|nr:uncharacterized protein HMPREF1541_02752 [Cyphellophora europaea CBS 101466]ETN43593.1 hypothetical protein HMPREF1541_02752 [Cyphellophora europaea CBS 101466]
MPPLRRNAQFTSPVMRIGFSIIPWFLSILGLIFAGDLTRKALSPSDDVVRQIRLPMSSSETHFVESARAIIKVVENNLPDFEPFESTYKKIHQNPELSRQENGTSRYPAQHLAAQGFEVIEKLGGHGVVGVLHNGPGPTVLLRADMDALPLEEKTGLPYASTKRERWDDGKEYPVMHACGHDMHVAVLLATASTLKSAAKSWNGTLICLFQPSEEAGGGAMAMIKDGLYDKVPRPDVVLGQHVVPTKAGSVQVKKGAVLAGNDSYNIRIYGKGGHGAKPHLAVNPIFIAAHIISRLPEIVATKVPPEEFAILNIGSIHAGHAENVIPDHVDMKLTMRHSVPKWRDVLRQELHRVIQAECDAAGSPRKPDITRYDSSPPTVNDDETAGKIYDTFREHFKHDAWEMRFDTGSEDFSDLATVHGIPYAYWNFGGVPVDQWDDAVRKGTVDEIPENHSPLYAPAIQPTLRSGTEAFALAALTFLDTKSLERSLTHSTDAGAKAKI